MKRAMAMLILICILLCSFSCNKAGIEEQSAAVRVPLTVSTPECIYSAQFCNEIAGSLTSTVARTLLTQKEITLTESDCDELTEYIKTNLLPIAQAIPVYPNELREICSIADELSQADNTTAEDISALYTRAYAAVGGERTGKLCYDYLLFYLDYAQMKAENYYEQTGYPWYAEDITAITHQKELLCDVIGRDDLSLTLSSVFLTANAISGGFSTYSYNEGFINGNDISLLIDEYLAELDSLNVSKQKWKATWELFELFELEKFYTNDTLITFAIEAMRSDNIISSIGELTPEILRLSSEFTRYFTKNTDKESYEITDAARESFFEFDKSLRSALISSDNILAAIKRAGKIEDFEAFRKDCPSLSAHELLNSLSSSEKQTSDELQNLSISYVFSISPEFAYIASYMTQSEVTE